MPCGLAILQIDSVTLCSIVMSKSRRTYVVEGWPRQAGEGTHKEFVCCVLFCPVPVPRC